MPLAQAMAWDAACFLNLLATGYAEQILDALGCEAVLVRQTKEQEILFLRSPDGSGNRLEIMPVVDQLIEDGCVTLLEMTSADVEAHLHWAAQMRGGEAYCFAVAETRGMTVATDDRSCTNKARQVNPHIPCVTTPEWLKMWADSGSVSDHDVRQAKQNIVVQARFNLKPLHPLFSWWDAL